MLLGLLALIAVAVAGTTEVVLQHYLLGRLDSQLTAAVARSAPAFGGRGDPNYGVPGGQDDGGDGDDGGPASLKFLGTVPGTIQASYADGKLQGSAKELETNGTTPNLSAAATAVLATVPLGNRAVSRELPGLGEYRLVTTKTMNGVVLVTGLPLSGVNDTVLRMGLAELGVTVIGLLVAGVAGASILRVTLRPLQRVAATATRVTELELDRGEVPLSERVPEQDTDPRTEVGQVGAALNSLLGHVDSALSARQASETRVRQFVADASHELRTPLAAIRGYAELTRRGREQSPPDVAHALARVESEAQRMTSMVEDLLLLARLDAGRPLEVAPVDLTSMVIDAVSDAHAAGPDHDWRVDLPDEAVEVPGDAQRLHQVLTNLLANARVHTPSGTPVTVGLRVEGPIVVMTVTDEGPGVPEDLIPRVFERFARGDSSRSRAAGSTGLGLAIVAAVVAAHNGSVALTSRPGQTVFSVRLPS